MNKAFEKIIEELEKNASRYTKKYVTPYGNNGYRDTKAISVNKAIEIVKQEAEKYNSGWIPCSERMPEETEKLYLVTYKKFILGNFRYFMDIAYLSPLPDGTLEWVSEKAPVTRKVEAWQELPEEYKGH